MSLNDTIDKAITRAGSQNALAKLMGEHTQHISNYKKGRPCGFKKQAQFAAAAGEDATIVILTAIADTLDSEVAHEATVRTEILRMLGNAQAGVRLSN